MTRKRSATIKCSTSKLEAISKSHSKLLACGVYAKHWMLNISLELTFPEIEHNIKNSCRGS